jgi:hypothetical protein
MPTILPLRTNVATGAISWLKRGLLAAYCVSLVTVCSLLVVKGPQLRAAADAGEAHVAEEESKTFCSKFGFGWNSSLCTMC